MYGIKAYTEAGTHKNYIPGLQKPKKTENNGFTEIIQNSGDCLHLSDQALEMIGTGKTGLSNCPQDATYDQYGNVNRQIYAVQRDLSELANSVFPLNYSIGGQVSRIQNQVKHLQMQI